jgi:hypothetical protein
MVRRWWQRYALVAVLALPGCAQWSAPQTQALLAPQGSDLPRVVEWSATPFYPQTDYQCGPAALATAMAAVGQTVSVSALAGEVFVPGRQGSLQIEMLAAPRRHGLIGTRLPASLPALLREVAAGHVPVVLLNLGLPIYPLWHYAAVVGYDLERGDIVLRSGTTQRLSMPLFTFEHTWVRAGQWAFVALPPDQLPAAADEQAVVNARVAFEAVAESEQSAQAYRRALRRWPQNGLLSLGLGNVLAAQGKLDAAAVVFERATRQHDQAAAWNNLADVRMQLGDLVGAQEAARMAVNRAQSEPAWLAVSQETLRQIERRQRAQPSS